MLKSPSISLSLLKHLAYMFQLASRTPIAKDCADCALADCTLEFVTDRCRDLGSPRLPTSSADSESVREAALNAPLGSFGGQF
eukprot:3119732-Alexandrium_andersonii.AAC.1